MPDKISADRIFKANDGMSLPLWFLLIINKYYRISLIKSLLCKKLNNAYLYTLKNDLKILKN